MTPEQQRIALAEFEGWSYQRTDADGGSFGWVSPEGGCLLIEESFPNYLNDLNAVHEVVSRLDGQKLITYAGKLKQLTDTEYDGHEAPRKYVAYCEASAAQRCEALLKTINKWVEE